MGLLVCRRNGRGCERKKKGAGLLVNKSTYCGGAKFVGPITASGSQVIRSFVQVAFIVLAVGPIIYVVIITA